MDGWDGWDGQKIMDRWMGLTELILDFFYILPNLYFQKNLQSCLMYLFAEILFQDLCMCLTNGLNFANCETIYNLIIYIVLNKLNFI